MNDRIQIFEQRPSDLQLGTAVGHGLIGTSSVVVVEDDATLTLRPQAIPILVFSVWMYAVWACMGIVMAIAEFPDKALFWVVWVIAALLIIPTMIGLFTWLNQEVGDTSYAVLDKTEQTVSLPRLKESWNLSQIKQMVFVDRYVEKDRIFQVALLIADGDRWLYAHLCNCGGTESRFLGFKSAYRKFAEHLGLEFKTLRFPRKQDFS